MKRRRFLYGSALVGGIGVSGLAAALLTSPALAGHPGWHGHFGHGPGHGFCPGASGDPRELEGDGLRDHLARLLRPAQPSEEQLQRITGIAEDALADLCGLHERAAQPREAVAAALSAEPVDRAALEAARSEAVAGLSTASERVLRAVADAAEVLNAGQRAQLVLAHERQRERGRRRHRWFRGE